MKANVLRFGLRSSAWVDRHLVNRYFRSSHTRLDVHRDGSYFWNRQVDRGEGHYTRDELETDRIRGWRYPQRKALLNF